LWLQLVGDYPVNCTSIFVIYGYLYIIDDMKRYTLIICLSLMTINTDARQVDPGMPGGDPDVPIDGGISLLLLAGGAYGIKKIKDANRQ
jgi:hypothetical protein